MTDNVDHPAHYKTGKFECIEVMLETQGAEATKDFCVCNALKYIYRQSLQRWHIVQPHCRVGIQQRHVT